VPAAGQPGYVAAACRSRQPRLRSVSEKEHLRHRQRVGMCDGQQRGSNPHTIGAGRRAAVQPQLRRSGQADHFDVLPEHAARMTGPQRFHGRFFRGESSCEMRNRIAAPGTISDLPIGEDTPQEAVAVPLEGRANAGNIGGVESESENVHDLASA